MPEAPKSRPAKPAKPAKWRDCALTPEPYNPLDLENVGRSVEAALLRHDPEPLGSIEIMIGAGAYALYYTGPNELYASISSDDCITPIYVGQARPEGTRKGNTDPSKVSAPLWDRLGEHRISIEQVHDLDVAHFKVRYLVAIEAFVSLAERVMIKDKRPVWNVVVDGFGNHDPGAKRRTSGKRPPWDALHPGRWWSHPLNMPTASLISADESRRRLAAHFKGDPAQLASELTDDFDDDEGQDEES